MVMVRIRAAISAMPIIHIAKSPAARPIIINSMPLMSKKSIDTKAVRNTVKPFPKPFSPVPMSSNNSKIANKSPISSNPEIKSQSQVIPKPKVNGKKINPAAKAIVQNVKVNKAKSSSNCGLGLLFLLFLGLIGSIGLAISELTI